MIKKIVRLLLKFYFWIVLLQFSKIHVVSFVLRFKLLSMVSLYVMYSFTFSGIIGLLLHFNIFFVEIYPCLVHLTSIREFVEYLFRPELFVFCLLRVHLCCVLLSKNAFSWRKKIFITSYPLPLSWSELCVRIFPSNIMWACFESEYLVR